MIERKNILLSALFKSSEVLKPIIVAPLIISIHGIDSFALYSLVITFIVMVFPLIDGGVLTYSQRELYAKSNESYQKIFNIVKFQICCSPFLFVIFFFIFQIIESDIMYRAICSCYLIFFAFSTTFNGFYRAQNKFGTLVTIKFIFDILDVTIIALYAYYSREFTLDIFLYLLMSKILYFSCQLIFLKIQDKLKISLYLDAKDAITFFKSSYILVPVALLDSLAGNIERFLINDIVSTAEAGFYIVLMQYVFYLKLIVYPLTFTQLPVLSSLWDSNDLDALKKKVFKFLNYILIFTILLGALFWFAKPLIYEQFIGIELDSYKNNAILLFLITVIFLNINSIFMMVMIISKKIKSLIVLKSLTLIFALSININFLPDYGYIVSVLTLLLLAILTTLYLGWQFILLKKQ